VTRKSKLVTDAAEPLSMRSFETALKELEVLVERMEKGDRSLEESLQDFERGVTLTRQCQEALKTAEQKVQQLMEQNGKASLVPFDETTDRD
jgi:exodeoxyribonuclease VII small subunit